MYSERYLTGPRRLRAFPVCRRGEGGVQFALGLFGDEDSQGIMY